MDITALKVLHEDLIYVIEDAAEGLTGDGKHELYLALEKLRPLTNTPWDNQALIAEAEYARESYRDGQDAHRFAPVIKLRRQVRNTIAALLKQPEIYNYADPFLPQPAKH